MKPFLCLVVMTFSGISQTFQLGSSLDDVYAEFGVPKKWWEPEPQRYLTSFENYRAAVGIGTVVQDVYDRATKTNTYEIHLTRRTDSRDTRPKIRLAGLEFLIGKPGAFREILSDIAEAGNICATGCSLYGLDGTNSYSVLAYPINPLTGHTQEATAAAYGYKRDSNMVHIYAWGLKLSSKRRDSFLKINDGAGRDWASSKIENVQIRPTSLDYELRTSTGQGKPQLLGSWKP
jgi:hypothetical protein